MLFMQHGNLKIEVWRSAMNQKVEEIMKPM